MPVCQKTKLWILPFILAQWTDISFAQGFSRGVTRELWQSLPGNHVFNLTSSPRYQGQPNIKDTMKHFDAYVNIGDDYGQRLTAFYRAPETGAYVFYMTCQDECELWLSFDDKRENKQRVIFVPFGLNLNLNEWDRNAAQMSSPMNLVSGEFYFMQAIMKAGSNPSDHLGVGVRQPSGKKSRPILNPDLYCEIPEKRSAFFLLIQNDATLIGHVMYSRSTVSNMVCSLYCARDLNCQSYNYYREQGTCELNNDTTVNNAKGLVPNREVDYYEKLEPKLQRSHDQSR